MHHEDNVFLLWLALRRVTSCDVSVWQPRGLGSYKAPVEEETEPLVKTNEEKLDSAG